MIQPRGGNADSKLVVAVSCYVEIFQRDMMRELGMAFSLDRIHWQISTIQFQIPDNDVLNIDETNRIGTGSRKEASSFARGRSFHDNWPVGPPLNAMQRQAIVIITRLQQKPVTRFEPRHNTSVIFRACRIIARHRQIHLTGQQY
jgi:hypothetical protein